MLRAAAWSVPAVALAVSAPGAAASTSAFYVYQWYAGWNDAYFVLEAYIRLRSDDSPVLNTPVSWTVVETGQVFTANTNNSNGFARIDAVPDSVVGTPGFVDIRAGDAYQQAQVQGTRPVG